MPGSYGAEDQTQDFLHARQALYELVTSLAPDFLYLFMDVPVSLR